jgi:hypothetical protein
MLFFAHRMKSLNPQATRFWFFVWHEAGLRGLVYALACIGQTPPVYNFPIPVLNVALTAATKRQFCPAGRRELLEERWRKEGMEIQGGRGKPRED